MTGVDEDGMGSIEGGHCACVGRGRGGGWWMGFFLSGEGTRMRFTRCSNVMHVSFVRWLLGGVLFLEISVRVEDGR